MKTSQMKKWALMIAVATSIEAQAKKSVNVSKDVDTLGGNQALVEMATAMDPRNRSRIVQNRLVDRNNRLEFNLSYGAVGGGDPYIRTQNFGAGVEFHFTPRWSIGARYYDYGNELTPEGKRSLENARNAIAVGGVDASTFDYDYPMNATMGIISWYPVYGKTNLLDYGIAQFDIYLLAGGGSIELSSGRTGIATGGAGVGFWVNKHFTIRSEVRYQTYQDRIYTGERKIDTVTGQLGIGLML